MERGCRPLDPHQPVRRAGVALLATVALVSAACSDSDGLTTSDESSTTTATSTTMSTTSTTTSTTTTSTTSTTTTTTSTTTTESPSGCPGDGALPAEADNHTLAGGDVDGDGLVDTLHAYSIGDPSTPGGWWIQVSFAAGGGHALQLFDIGTSVSGARPFDGFDINGDGTEEFFAVVGAGASATIMGLFDVEDCELRRVTLGGQPSEFAVGGGLNFINGFDCVDIDGNGANDFLVTYSGARLGETEEFEVIGSQYALLDGELSLIVADGLGVNQGDPLFATYSSAGCNVG